MAESKIQLPSPKTKRWVQSKMATVVRAAKLGHYTKDEIVAHYDDMSMEELESWISIYNTYGIIGLGATRTQEYRRP